jgi:hypothetical protein
MRKFARKPTSLHPSFWPYISTFLINPLKLRRLSSGISDSFDEDTEFWTTQYSTNNFAELVTKCQSRKRKMVRKSIQKRRPDGAVDLGACMTGIGVSGFILNETFPFKKFTQIDNVIFLTANFANAKLVVENSELGITFVQHNVDPNEVVWIRRWSFGYGHPDLFELSNESDNYTVAKSGGALVSLWRIDYSVVSVTFVIPIWDTIKGLFPDVMEGVGEGDKLIADIAIISVLNNTYDCILQRTHSWFWEPERETSFLNGESIAMTSLEELRVRKSFNGWRLHAGCVVISLTIYNERMEILNSSAEFCKLEKLQEPSYSFDMINDGQLKMTNDNVECVVHIARTYDAMFISDITVKYSP